MRSDIGSLAMAPALPLRPRTRSGAECGTRIMHLRSATVSRFLGAVFLVHCLLAPTPALPDDTADKARGALATAIEGLGGLSALESLENFSILSSTTQFGKEGDIPLTSKVTFKGKRFFRQDVVMSFGQLILIYDGTQAWQLSDGGSQKQPASQRDLWLVRRRMARSLPILLLETHRGERNLEFVQSAKHNGVPVEMVRVTDSEGDQVTLSIDTATGRVLRIAYFSTTLQNEPVEEVELRSEFRPVHGLVLPFRQVIFREGKKIREVKILDYGVNDPLDQRLFDPDQRPQLVPEPDPD